MLEGGDGKPELSRDCAGGTRNVQGGGGGGKVLSSPRAWSSSRVAYGGSLGGLGPLVELTDEWLEFEWGVIAALALARLVVRLLRFILFLFLRFLEGVSGSSPPVGEEPGPTSDSEDIEPITETIKVASIRASVRAKNSLERENGKI